jgi:hypothetical protein
MRIPGSRTAMGNNRLRRNIVGRGNCEPPPPHARCFRGSRTPAKKASGELGGVGGGEGRRGGGPGGSVRTTIARARARARVVREGHTCRWMK